MASKTIVGIDIGAHCVKAARVEDKGGFTVLGIGEEPMPPNASIEQQKEAIQKALNQAGARRSRCAIGVPRDQVVLRRIDKLPKDLDASSMQEVVRLQADSELPFDHGEAVYDYLNVRESEESASVEIVAARLSEVERIVNSVREAGGKPVAIAPSVFAIPALARLDAGDESDRRHLLIVDIGHSGTEVGVVCDGSIETTRSFPIGADQLRSGDARVPSLFIGELTRTIQAHKRQFQDDKPFDDIWLWGGGASMRFNNLTEDGASVSLAQLIESQLGSPVHTNIEIKGFKDASKVSEEPAGWHRYGVALGLAVGELSGTLEANLIPRMDKEKHEQADRNRQALVCVIAAAALTAAIALLSAQIKSSQAADVRDLNNEIKKYRADKAISDREASKIHRMNAYLAPRYSVLDVLRELTALLPDRPSIAATAIQFSDSGEVQIELQASSHDIVKETAQKIAKSPWFDPNKISLSQVTTLEENRRQIHQFRVTAQVSANAPVLAVRQIGSGNEPTADGARQGQRGGGQTAQRGEGENRQVASRQSEGAARGSGPRGNGSPQRSAQIPVQNAKMSFEGVKSGAEIEAALKEALEKGGVKLDAKALEELKSSGVTVIEGGSGEFSGTGFSKTIELNIDIGESSEEKDE
ncbi:MAG: pilus assembly protein PilM [Candidatus Poribacteria bacterium]|nr:pilus assembly protein PilM [Candidatus Poribacteria bacterium]